MDVLLFENLFSAPLEALDQIAGVHVQRVLCFEPGKQPLQLVQDAVLFLSIALLVVPPTVDDVAELTRHEQRLEQAVHVARRANISQTLVRLLLRRLFCAHLLK